MSKYIQSHVLAPPFEIVTRKGARPVGVRFLENYIAVDMEESTGTKQEKKTFSVVGINQSVPNGATYVGSVSITEEKGTYLLFVFMN